MKAFMKDAPRKYSNPRGRTYWASQQANGDAQRLQGRGLATRTCNLKPRHRHNEVSTALFERYARIEKVPLSVLAEIAYRACPREG